MNEKIVLWTRAFEGGHLAFREQISDALDALSTNADDER